MLGVAHTSKHVFLERGPAHHFSRPQPCHPRPDSTKDKRSPHFQSHDAVYIDPTMHRGEWCTPAGLRMPASGSARDQLRATTDCRHSLCRSENDSPHTDKHTTRRTASGHGKTQRSKKTMKNTDTLPETNQARVQGHTNKRPPGA